VQRYDIILAEVENWLKRRYPDEVFSEFSREVGIVYSYVQEKSEPKLGISINALPSGIASILQKLGINHLYKFQEEAYMTILADKSVMIVAGTATGKTEAFLVPIVQKIHENPSQRPLAILVYPTKALARDQLNRNKNFNTSVVVYDGDTPKNERTKITRNPPQILITTPDMLHFFPLSSAIQMFIKNAKYFVFDELHVYEGVLGCHLKYLIERIKLFKNQPIVLIGSSATVGNPGEFASLVFGTEVEIIQDDSRKSQIVHTMISCGNLSRWSFTAYLCSFLSKLGLKFIVFVDSQQMAEVVTKIAKYNLGVRVSTHRAGLLAEERRAIEDAFKKGELDGIVATPTLEVGINIPTVDAIIMPTIPANFSRYLQRAGRSGRIDKPGYVFLILSDDPISCYYIENPKKYFVQQPHPIAIEPLNEEVIKVHLSALNLQTNLKEKPFDIPEKIYEKILTELELEGIINRYGKITKHTAKTYVYIRQNGLRSSPETISIYEIDSKKQIGSRDLPVAITDLHPEAIYLVSGRTYRVKELDLKNKIAKIKRLPDDTPLYSRPLYDIILKDYSIIASRKIHDIPLAYAHVSLEVVVRGYILLNIKREKEKEEKRFITPVSYCYNTKAIILKYPIIKGWDDFSCAEAFHALEHVLITAAEPVVGASTGSMGGFSYPSGEIIIYDATIGGSGLSKILFERFEQAEEIAYEILRKCDCEDGCPSCIFSVFCGNYNQILSRQKALFLLETIFDTKIKKELPYKENFKGVPIA